MRPVSLLANPQHVRSWYGGIGEVKAGGYVSHVKCLLLMVQSLIKHWIPSKNIEYWKCSIWIPKISTKIETRSLKRSYDINLDWLNFIFCTLNFINGFIAYFLLFWSCVQQVQWRCVHFTQEYIFTYWNFYVFFLV